MPAYRYTALSSQGALLQGTELAGSERELREALEARHLLVVRLTPQRALTLRSGSRRVRPEVFLSFNQELAALLRAGLTVADALSLARERPEDPRFGCVLDRILGSVRQGESLSAACGQFPEIFDALYRTALRTGEASGQLPMVLARHQLLLRQRLAMRKRVSQALAYPVFLLITLVVVLAILFAFVLPRFTAVYADFGVPLPWATRGLMQLVETLPWWGSALAALVVLGTMLLRRGGGEGLVARLLESIQDRLPVWGALRRLVALSLLSRALSTLLAAGTPLVEALRTAGELTPGPGARARMASARRAVLEGARLADALHEHRLVTPAAAKMLAVGEASGSLEAMLDEVAHYSEELIEERLARLSALVEPMLMLLMGLLIGAIIVVMYLPIFQLADVIR